MAVDKTFNIFVMFTVGRKCGNTEFCRKFRMRSVWFGETSELSSYVKMMSLAPKKDGGPNSKFYESPETISLFDGIRTWLQKNCKKV